MNKWENIRVKVMLAFQDSWRHKMSEEESVYWSGEISDSDIDLLASAGDRLLKTPTIVDQDSSEYMQQQIKLCGEFYDSRDRDLKEGEWLGGEDSADFWKKQ